MNYTLLLDEPWTFLNARRNPVEGRKLTFELEDGTLVTLNVSMSEYRNPDKVRAKLQDEIEAHSALLSI
jgi:hypothetical protein